MSISSMILNELEKSVSKEFASNPKLPMFFSKIENLITQLKPLLGQVTPAEFEAFLSAVNITLFGGKLTSLQIATIVNSMQGAGSIFTMGEDIIQELEAEFAKK